MQHILNKILFQNNFVYTRWSPEGRKGQQCIQWYAKEGRDGWDDNFLCINTQKNNENIIPPIHGNWGEWKRWSRCSKECGGGKKRRLRLCNNPKPQHGGKYCTGNGHEEMSCHTQECRKFCQFLHRTPVAKLLACQL